MFGASVLQIPVIGVGTERFIVLLLAAFTGGMFGVALGALPSFIFTGFIVLLGEAAGIIIRQFEGASLVTTGKLGTSITSSTGFGPFIGPHTAFAGGTAISAYASKRHTDMDPSEGGYHFGKDITYVFGTQPDILAVGSLFGILRLLISRIAGGIGLPLDSVASSVATTVFIACIALDCPLVDSPAGNDLLDMSPFEKGMMRGDGNDRPAAEPWSPHQYKWVNIVVIDLRADILGGWTWLVTESFFLAYGISAANPLFLNLGVERIPVIHHTTLGGSAFGAVAAPMVGRSELLIITAAAVGDLIGALFGEVTQRMVYVHSGMHVDPPVMSIIIYLLLIGVLFPFGIIPNSAYLGF